MHDAFLMLHSILRWAVLLAAILAIVVNIQGWLKGGEWTKQNKMLNIAFIATLDLNVLLGLILYVGVSPMMSGIFSDFGGAMKNSVLRFWAVEHITGMILGLIIAHVAQVMSKKSDSDQGKFKRAAIGFGLSLFIIFGSIPWPFRGDIGRALLPF